MSLPKPLAVVGILSSCNGATEMEEMMKNEPNTFEVVQCANMYIHIQNVSMLGIV